MNLPVSITALSEKYGFTRSARYDPAWLYDNAMGPNPLWLMEWLSRDMTLKEGMVVLDMGCGKALTSIFTAREFGCTVLANDLWIAAEDNLKRITEAGLFGKVFPIQAEAHALPYAKGQFDAIISLDAYHYFGTADTYLPYFLDFLKPGGQLGLVFPGWSRDPDPAKLYWPESEGPYQFTGFHTLEWWTRHLSVPPLVRIEKAACLENAGRIWLDSARAMYETKKILRLADGTPAEAREKELEFWSRDIDYLEKDREGYYTLMSLVIRKQ